MSRHPLSKRVRKALAFQQQKKDAEYRALQQAREAAEAEEIAPALDIPAVPGAGGPMRVGPIEWVDVVEQHGKYDPTVLAGDPPGDGAGIGSWLEQVPVVGIEDPLGVAIEGGILRAGGFSVLEDGDPAGVAVEMPGGFGQVAFSDQPRELATFCPECGYGVVVDEDGCCASCGATATGAAVDAMSAPKESPVPDGYEQKYIALKVVDGTSVQGYVQGARGFVDLTIKAGELSKLYGELVDGGYLVDTAGVDRLPEVQLHEPWLDGSLPVDAVTKRTGFHGPHDRRAKMHVGVLPWLRFWTVQKARFGQRRGEHIYWDGGTVEPIPPKEDESRPLWRRLLGMD